ncbi:MAG: FAD:protein FMN transferase [bacterium]
MMIKISKKTIITLSTLLIIYSFFYILRIHPSPQIYKESQFLMGTIIEISVVSTSETDAHRAIQVSLYRLKEIERMMNFWDTQSELSLLNQRAPSEEVVVKQELYYLIKKAVGYSQLTEGAFDITIGPVFRLWNFRDGGGNLPAPFQLSQALTRIGYTNIIFNDVKHSLKFRQPNLEIDLGGIAKGYAADQAVLALKNSGIDSALVSVGGNLKALGKKQKNHYWNIGIRHPRKEEEKRRRGQEDKRIRRQNELLATLTLTDKAVSTSGDYERFFIKDGIRYHHILNPKDGYPANDCQSVTIVATEATTADALSTGVFILGPKKGLALIEAQPGVEGVIVDKEGKTLISSGLRGKIKILGYTHLN